MIKAGTIKPVFLLALGIVAIALVGSAAGDTMGQCPYNQTCMMMQSSMGDHQDNKTMMCCMVGEHLANGSCCIVGMDQNASTFQSRLNCTDFWLEKAIELHELHMEDPSTETNESQMELMDLMKQAHECIIGENATMEMKNNTTVCNASAGHDQVCICVAQSRLNCADFWLEQAIELHEMHLKDHSTATDESQMEMMDHMMHAHECVIGKSEAMEMTYQARMDCASAWLKKAMEMRELYMKEHGAETNESQMEMMEQMMDHMMHAYECMNKENMTMKMMNNTTWGQFSGEYEHRC